MADRTRGRRVWGLAGLIAAATLGGCGGERERAGLLLTAPRLFDGERLILDGAGRDPRRRDRVGWGADALSEEVLAVRGGQIQVGG